MTSELNQKPKLFNHLSEEHGLILLESELQEVVRIVIEGLDMPTEEDIDQSSHRYYFDLEEKREKSKNFRGQIAGRHPDMLSSREMFSQMIGFVDGANYILNKLKGGKQVMENTPLNKAKFYALYWGQKVMYVEGAGLVAIGSGGWNLGHPDFFLELKSLLSISDEDAKALVKLRLKLDRGDVSDIDSIELSMLEIIQLLNAVYVKANITYKNNDSFTETVETIFSVENTLTEYMLIDYLRSRGYATPWMGLSVDKLLEYGWIKLKGGDND